MKHVSLHILQTNYLEQNMSTSSIHKYHPKNVSLESQIESSCFGGRSRGLSLSFNEFRASSKK